MLSVTGGTKPPLSNLRQQEISAFESIHQKAAATWLRIKAVEAGVQRGQANG